LFDSHGIGWFSWVTWFGWLVGSASSVGPRFALNITALRAKIDSVVPTALIFIFALRAKMSLCMESVESVCLEAGGALRLKFIENLI
jgi:hypothetical protein